MPAPSNRTRSTTFQGAPTRIGRQVILSPRMTMTIDLNRPHDPPVVTPSPRQPLQVGNLVSVHIPQRTEYLDFGPNAHVAVGSFDVPVARRLQSGHFIGVVTDIAPGGRMFHLKELFPARSSAACYLNDAGTELQNHTRYRRSDNGTEEFVSANTPINDSDVEAMFRYFEPKVRAARTSHITKVWSLSEIPKPIVDHLRKVMVSDVAKKMFKRLGELCSAGRVDRLAWAGSANHRAGQMRRIAGTDYPERMRQAVRAAIDYAKSHRLDLAAEKLNQAATFVHYQRDTVRRNTVDDIRDKVRDRLVATVSKACGRKLYMGACGHLHSSAVYGGPDATEYVVDSQGHTPVMGKLCPLCAINGTSPVQWYDGRTLVVWRVVFNLYQWGDGTYHLTREPTIIGDYHSCKNTVGYVPPLAPRRDGKLGWPTIGFELEVEAVGGKSAKNGLAKEIRTLVAEKLGDATAERYMGFERDGSLGDDGFECVSGWTDLRTHATVMRNVLLDDQGRNRWVGKLLSHKAEASCGLHVHIQKPSSLVHAAKVRYMMSSPTFKKLIKSVARRYNVDYARVAGHDGDGGSHDYGAHDGDYFDRPEVCAAKHLKFRRDDGGYSTKRVIADMRLNFDRYEHVNFHNAATMEFRVYKGTTVYGTFMACLELTNAVWFYTRDTAATAMTQDSFLRYIERPEMSKDTANLRRLLNLKGFTVRVPNVRKGDPAPVYVTEFGVERAEYAMDDSN